MTDIAMELTVVVAFTSLVVSIISSIYGFTQNRKLQEFEHRTREDTKEDLVKLDTALKSIIIKSSYRNDMRNLVFDAEKNIISDFLLSPTWLAIEYLINQNGDKTVLHVELLIILNRQDGITIGFAAHNAERELSRISSQYQEELLNLKDNIYTMLPEISGDNVDRLSKTAVSAVKDRITYNDDYVKDAFRYLKEVKGVTDPNIDLFLAVLDNNEELLKQSIDAGGNLAMDDKDLLKKYEKLLKDHKFVRKPELPA
ncbi:MAG TPA: hypothetical protein O0X46_01215 [Methanocorpusculum sp.]|nr:hypothetical protein [Candidatus Methanocorpusculum faecipullorum]HJK07720.1 hypothetical protein [Methanocorpusculum sp.]HJK10156.1 hypothetical protein [Methanocorpusculum sp.]HJK13821.1 hypothetical protein [Methanocorpusculum sp.]HJK21994.1 hypothetical protein [Methanocorpusculum sp.]